MRAAEEATRARRRPGGGEAATQQGGTTVNGVTSPGPGSLGGTADATVQFPVQATLR